MTDDVSKSASSPQECYEDENDVEGEVVALRDGLENEILFFAFRTFGLCLYAGPSQRGEMGARAGNISYLPFGDMESRLEAHRPYPKNLDMLKFEVLEIRSVGEPV